MCKAGVTHHTSSHFTQVVEQADPDLVALHCQEIGGKDFESCMPKVDEFVRYVCVCVRERERECV